MARRIRFKSFAKSATATAAQLSATDLHCTQVLIQNNDASNDVYIGGSDVTSSNGVKIAKGSSLSLDCNITPTDVRHLLNLIYIYVVCASAQTADLRILYQDQEANS